MSISLEQEIAAQAAVATLEAKINLGRAWIIAGTWVPGVGGFGEPQTALSGLDRIEKAVNETLAGPYLQKAIDGHINWEEWVAAAEGYGSDIEYQVGNTGILSELSALREVPGDVGTTVKEGVDQAKDALPYVAAGLGAFAALVLAIVVIWELR